MSTRSAGRCLPARTTSTWRGRGLFMTFDKNKGVRRDRRRPTSADRPPRYRRSRRSTRFINVGETEYDALLLQLEKRLARGFSARVSYTLSSARGNTSSNGSGAINFQAGQDLNLALNEGAERLRSPSQPRRQRTHARAVHARHDVQLGGARAQRAAVHAHQQHHRRRSQRHAVRSHRRGSVYRRRHACRRQLLGGLRRRTQRRSTARASFSWTRAMGWRLPLGKGRTLDVSADVFNLTNRANFANPERQSGRAGDVPGALGAARRRRAAHAPDRGALGF